MAARVVQSSRKSSMREAEAPPEASLYPSLASLQSEEIEDEFSCSACCKKGEGWREVGSINGIPLTFK